MAQSIGSSFGRPLDAAFLNVVNVEPYVYDFVLGDEFRDVTFEEFLQFDWQVAGTGRAHRIVPGDDFSRFSSLGVAFDPNGNRIVVRSACDETPECLS